MTPHSRLTELRLLLGIERNTTRHGEKWISGIGALLGILAVYGLTRWTFPSDAASAVGGALMVTSMGASAVLLFAVPQGALSQPWAVVGGHLLSAFIGVSCQKLFPGHAWTAAVAVGLAVLGMYYLRCIHPPGGATALAAVIGGPDVHALGYGYLLMPVLINVAAILSMAIAFNALFPWRRYPAHLHRRRQASRITQPAQRQFELTQEDFSAAMEQLNSYVTSPPRTSPNCWNSPSSTPNATSPTLTRSSAAASTATANSAACGACATCWKARVRRWRIAWSPVSTRAAPARPRPTSSGSGRASRWCCRTMGGG